LHLIKQSLDKTLLVSINTTILVIHYVILVSSGLYYLTTNVSRLVNWDLNLADKWVE